MEVKGDSVLKGSGVGALPWSCFGLDVWLIVGPHLFTHSRFQAIIIISTNLYLRMRVKLRTLMLVKWSTVSSSHLLPGCLLSKSPLQASKRILPFQRSIKPLA